LDTHSYNHMHQPANSSLFFLAQKQEIFANTAMHVTSPDVGLQYTDQARPFLRIFCVNGL